MHRRLALSSGTARFPAHLVHHAARRRQVGVAVGAVMLLAVMVAGSAFDWWPTRADGEVRTETETHPANPLTGELPSVPVEASSFFNVEGRVPDAFPDTRLGLGFLALDQPLGEAIAVLGSATSRQPDIFGTAHTWVLPGGAELTVSADDDAELINGLYAAVPPGSPVRIGVFGGVVIGRSTLADVVAAWGPGSAMAASPLDDYVVSYLECVGAFPVVVKFDQPSTIGGAAPSAARWDAPITSVLVAYADEPPGRACPR